MSQNKQISDNEIIVDEHFLNEVLLAADKTVVIFLAQDH